MVGGREVSLLTDVCHVVSVQGPSGQEGESKLHFFRTDHNLHFLPESGQTAAGQ